MLQENPVDICSRMNARSNDCTLDDCEIEDGTDPSLCGHDRIPVKWAFLRAIEVVLCIKKSQGLTVDAHKINRGRFDAVFAAEVLDATGT